MPCLKSDAPPGTPDERTIESLMGARNHKNNSTATIKCLHELTEEEKTNVGLAKFGKRCTKIPGDPFGVLSSWAGNIAHHQDDRMVCKTMYSLILNEFYQSVCCATSLTSCRPCLSVLGRSLG